MRKSLFFLCILLAAALAERNAFGEEDSSEQKTRHNIKIFTSVTNERVSIEVLPSDPCIFLFRKERFRERLQEIPFPVLGSNDSDPSNLIDLRMEEKHPKEKESGACSSDSAIKTGKNVLDNTADR